jgi:hypothetical protein
MTTISPASPLSTRTTTEQWEALRDLEWKPGYLAPEAVQKASPEAIAIRARLEEERKKGAVEHNNPTPESNDMYLQNVALLTPDFVLKEIENVKFMIQNKADEGLVVHAANGNQQTSSLQTYLSWLQERAPADILKTANAGG